MTEDRDPPIEPLDYLHGLKVVDIGDMRIKRGMTRRPASSCRHSTVHYDKQERRLWCPDCEKNVEAFDVVVGIAESLDAKTKGMEKREQKLKEVEEERLVSLAARAIDKLWRRRNMVPCCPNCNEGLLPEDFKDFRGAMVNADWTRAKRKKKVTK